MARRSKRACCYDGVAPLNTGSAGALPRPDAGFLLRSFSAVNQKLLKYGPLSAVLLGSALFARNQSGPLEPSTPVDGAAVVDNRPTLGWSGTPPAGSAVEVWIDGVCAGRLPGDLNALEPFPLSYGEHRWRVDSVAPDGRRQQSRTCHFLVQGASLAPLPSGGVLLREGWRVQSAAAAGDDGTRISARGLETTSWSATSVPATVLTALVRNGIYPNPLVGLNNTRIPDSSDRFNEAHGLQRFSHLAGRNPWRTPYWYRTEFPLPPSFAGRRVMLGFDEINYRADVWLNGRRVAGADRVVGMARRFRFEVTDFLVAGENVLAVEVHPVDEPGEPVEPATTPLADPGRNMGADAGISRNYAKWDAIGWDWQPAVPDRDMGITQDVVLYPEDPIEIRDLYAGACPAVPGLQSADLRFRFDLANLGGQAESGVFELSVAGPDGRTLSVEGPFKVGPGATEPVVLTPAEAPQLRISHPLPWWPAELGRPNLYTVQVRARSRRGHAAEALSTFGIRRIETGLVPGANARYFRINGRRIFARGGNWVDDIMLNESAARYGAEVTLALRAGLNFLRVWGPTGIPADALLGEADRQGLLIQQDFLNDNWGTEHNAPGNQPPLDVARAATSDLIRRFRNHPSLFLWCGGNEGPNPREALIRGELLPRLDPWGSRYYLAGSNLDGIQGGGPYDNRAPESYFSNPKVAGFNSEIGPSGVPEWDSLRQFIDFPPRSAAPGRFPLDGQWAYHDATDRPQPYEDRKFSHLDDLIRARYGAPAGLGLEAARGYVLRAQLLSCETYQAVLEALNRGLWTRTTGFCLWKANSSWPSAVWQLWDWYGRCDAGYYAAQRALRPLHVQFHPDSRRLGVIRREPGPTRTYGVRATLVGLSGRVLWDRADRIAVRAESVAETAWSVPSGGEVAFLKLRLLDDVGGVVDDNLYWVGSAHDFRPLLHLGAASVRAEIGREGGGGVVATLENRSRVPALLIRAQLVDPASGAEMLPTFWNDNDVSLLPGERVVLRARPAFGEPARIAVRLSGANLAPSLLTTPPAAARGLPAYGVRTASTPE